MPSVVGGHGDLWIQAFVAINGAVTIHLEHQPGYVDITGKSLNRQEHSRWACRLSLCVMPVTILISWAS